MQTARRRCLARNDPAIKRRSGSIDLPSYPVSLVIMNRPSNTFDIAIEQGFDFLSPDYAELFDNSAATAFQHPLWLDTLYTRLASHAGATPLVVVVRHRATGALAMVLPLLRIRRGPIRTVEFADLRVSDYLAPVCSPHVFSELLKDESACAEIRYLVRPFDLL